MMTNNTRISYFLSSTLAAMALMTSPVNASDGSLTFLNPVGPIHRIDGVTPGTGDYDAAAIHFTDNFGPVLNAHLSTYLDPVTEVYTAPFSDPNIVVPANKQVRFYFISENAGFTNQVGFVTGENFDLYDSANANSLIFPEVNTLSDPAGPFIDTLREGDYVVLSDRTGSGQTLFDFFVIADGADAQDNDGLVERVYWSEPGLNDDGKQHVNIVPFIPGLSPPANYKYYLLTFEDLNRDSSLSPVGSLDPTDYPIDFTDVIGVVQVSTPEPGTYLMMGSFLTLAVYVKRRRQGVSA